MNVYVERWETTIVILEEKTNHVICQLPGIMDKPNMPQILKALSIMMKELSNASRKHKRSPVKIT